MTSFPIQLAYLCQCLWICLFLWTLRFTPAINIASCWISQGVSTLNFFRTVRTVHSLLYSPQSNFSLCVFAESCCAMIKWTCPCQDRRESHAQYLRSISSDCLLDQISTGALPEIECRFAVPKPLRLHPVFPGWDGPSFNDMQQVGR